MSFISIVLLAALVLNTVLGLFVFLGKTKSASTSYYFILVLFISVWIFTNYLVEFVSTQNQAWWLATTAYVSILGIAYTFVSFCYHFPEQTFRWPTVVRYLTLVVTVLVGALIFVPGLVIDHIIISPWKIVTGTGLGIVFAWFIILMLAAFAVLITKLKRGTIPPEEKPQLELVLSGTIVAALLGSICNLGLPFVLQNYDYVRIGPIFTLILVACIATAIVRYQLFNIKVISVQTFTVVLCSFLFIRTLIATTLAEQLINGGLLVATLVTCVFLVRAALIEVEQREALAVANANQQNLIHIMNHQIKGYLGKDRTIFAELLTGEYGLIPETAKPLLTAVRLWPRAISRPLMPQKSGWRTGAKPSPLSGRGLAKPKSRPFWRPNPKIQRFPRRPKPRFRAGSLRSAPPLRHCGPSRRRPSGCEPFLLPSSRGPFASTVGPL